MKYFRPGGKDDEKFLGKRHIRRMIWGVPVEVDGCLWKRTRRRNPTGNENNGSQNRLYCKRKEIY